MNRRNFLGLLIKSAVVAAIGPTVIKALEEHQPKEIITVVYRGQVYWYDHQMWLLEKEWLQEQEKRIFAYHRPFKHN